jgi:hypothetical protein
MVSKNSQMNNADTQNLLPVFFLSIDIHLILQLPFKRHAL